MLYRAQWTADPATPLADLLHHAMPDLDDMLDGAGLQAAGPAGWTRDGDQLVAVVSVIMVENRCCGVEPRPWECREAWLDSIAA